MYDVSFEKISLNDNLIRSLCAFCWASVVAFLSCRSALTSLRMSRITLAASTAKDSLEEMSKSWSDWSTAAVLVRAWLIVYRPDPFRSAASDSRNAVAQPDCQLPVRNSEEIATLMLYKVTKEWSRWDNATQLWRKSGRHLWRRQKC